jgi:hypothetical protein
MPKPQKFTPVAHVVSLLEALPDWFATHAEALRDGLDGGLDGAALIVAQRDKLAQAQQTVVREQKEDVAATLEADELVTQGAALLASVAKTTQATLRQHPQHARLTRQIIEAAPSTYRTPNQMLAALKLASDGLQQHAALFAGRAALVGRLVERADALHKALEDAQRLRKKERVESRAAAAVREAALLEALALITTLDDGAQAIYFEAPTPYQTLRTLYEVHCPTPPRGTTRDEDEPTDPENDLTDPEDDLT